MGRVDARNDAGDPDPEQREHADLDDPDDEHAESDLLDPPPAQLQPDAEQQQDQAQFGKQPDGVQVADQRSGEGVRPDDHAGHQVPQHRRLPSQARQSQPAGGDHHRDGKVLQQRRGGLGDARAEDGQQDVDDRTPVRAREEGSRTFRSALEASARRYIYGPAQYPTCDVNRSELEPASDVMLTYRN